eukprot:gene19339-60076_t
MPCPICGHGAGRPPAAAIAAHPTAKRAADTGIGELPAGGPTAGSRQRWVGCEWECGGLTTGGACCDGKHPRHQQKARGVFKLLEQDLRASLSAQWHTGGLGQRWDKCALVFALISAAVYILETYLQELGVTSDERYQDGVLTTSKVLEFVMATFFSIDYGLRFFIADHRARFVRSVASVMDILCIIPVVFVFILPPPGPTQHDDWPPATAALGTP